MSELPQISTISDPELAKSMALQEAPFRDVALRMRETGQNAVADVVVQQGIMDAEALQPNLPPAETQEPAVLQTSKEQVENHERIVQEAAKETVAVFDMWFRGTERSAYGHFNGGHSQLQQVYTDRDFQEIYFDMNGVQVGFLDKWKNDMYPHQGATKEYTEQGINEAILVSPEIPNMKFGNGKPDSEYKDDPVVVVRYQTLKGYTGPDDRPGAYIKSQIYLPKTIADRIVEEVNRDPHTIRDLVDGIMDTRIHAGKDWELSRPPYEKWADANGGIEKMLVILPDATGEDYERTVLESRAA